MLDARQMDALAAVVTHGSFGAAAQTLSITLAAVSLRIKSLEAALGQRLLVRGVKPVRATPAGQALLGHVKQVQLMEADLLAGLQGSETRSGVRWQTLSVAINADSAAGWFLPGVAPLLLQHQLLIDITIDDQDHTHDALKNGDVLGCVTALAEPLRGCVAEALGVMRYRCVAAPEVVARCRTASGAVSPHQLLAVPAIIFNRKDALQDAFLAQHFGLRQPHYPRHFAPATDAFETALELGMGWGMVPEQHLKARPTLHEVLPGASVDVALYWQHWAHESLSAQRLTEAVKEAARAALAPLTPLTPPAPPAVTRRARARRATA